MKVLVIGSGGREHAIAYKLKQSPKVSELYAIPGNPGIASLGTCVPGSVEDNEFIVDFIQKNQIDLTVIGPEVPLCNGLADDIEKGPLGQKTHIESYREHNQALKADNPNMYKGIDDHLKQDVVYDKYVRDKIGPDRAAIFKDEDHAIYVAAAKIYEEQGILCNKQWLEENIKPILEEKMPELAENTFKYMHFSDPQYEKWVENADFTHLNEGPFPLKDYEKLYDDVSMFMQHGIDPTKDLNNVIMTSPGICVTNNTASEIKPFAFEDSDIGGLYITDNIEKIGIGAFNGCTGMSTVSMADELTAKTDAEIFSDTQIDTGAMKKVAETTKTAQFGKNMVQKTKTTEMEIGA